METEDFDILRLMGQAASLTDSEKIQLLMGAIITLDARVKKLENDSEAERDSGSMQDQQLEDKIKKMAKIIERTFKYG